MMTTPKEVTVEEFTDNQAHQLAELLTAYWRANGADNPPADTMTVDELFRDLMASSTGWAASTTVKVGHAWTMATAARS